MNYFNANYFNTNYAAFLQNVQLDFESKLTEEDLELEQITAMENFIKEPKTEDSLKKFIRKIGSLNLYMAFLNIYDLLVKIFKSKIQEKNKEYVQIIQKTLEYLLPEIQKNKAFNDQSMQNTLGKPIGSFIQDLFTKMEHFKENPKTFQLIFLQIEQNKQNYWQKENLKALLLNPFVFSEPKKENQEFLRQQMQKEQEFFEQQQKQQQEFFEQQRKQQQEFFEQQQKQQQEFFEQQQKNSQNSQQNN
jgi:hypothetical protein